MAIIARSASGFLRKVVIWFNGWPWGASQLNWQIIRYADILLWKAEALIELNEGNGLETARDLINQIRNRARNSAM